MADRVAILCVGPNDVSLKTRCLLLQREGFKVVQCAPEVAPSVLMRTAFDLIILPHHITKADQLKIRSEAGEKAKIIQLEAFTYPSQLLGLIRALESAATTEQQI